MGFPRTGCRTCKQRRIKCDLVRPLCGRCKKARYPCTWDSNEEEGIPFRNENAFAQGLARRPRKKGLTRNALVLNTPLRSSVPSALHIPVEIHAVNYWAENFVLRQNDLPEIGHEYPSYVESHWNRARPDSCLHLSLLAFAHAVFGRTKRLSTVMAKANRLYDQAFTKLREDIKDVATEDIDQLLLALMLLGSYENVMWELNPHNPGSASPSSEIGTGVCHKVCHQKGAVGLLRLRQLRRPIPHPPLDKVVRRQIIRILILRGFLVPDWLADSHYEDEGYMREFDLLMTRTTNLRVKSLELFRHDTLETLTLVSISQEVAAEARELDFALAEWSEAATGDWKFSAMPAPAGLHSPTTELLYDSPAHTYKSYGHATLWNRYRALRLIVNSIYMRALASLNKYPTQSQLGVEQQVQCQRNIDSLMKELCGGVLFLFNRYNPPSGNRAGGWSIRIGSRAVHSEREILPKMAALLAWPLTVAVSIEKAPLVQRTWLLARLKTVADSLGDGILVVLTEKQEFKF